MSLHFSPQSTTVHRTVSVSSDPSSVTLSPSVQYGVPDGSTVFRTVSMSSDSSSPYLSPGQYGIQEGGTVYRTLGTAGLQYATNGSQVDGNVVYQIVPVQQAMQQQSYVLVNRAPQVISQVMSPMYVQNVQRVAVEQPGTMYQHQEVEVDIRNGQSSSVFSHTSSPAKSPEPPQETVEVDVQVEVDHGQESVVTSFSQVEVSSPVPEVESLAKMDTRYFGELLAEVFRKNCDINTCISEHVSKIRGRKHLLDPTIDYKLEKKEVEDLIPKGVSELTKQQIRYLLQTRQVADKTMRLLLTTFSSLREELVQLQEDLRRMESEKEELERDLSFKADQAQQYDSLLEAVRENNRQLQVSLKESSSAQRALEMQMSSSRSTDSNKEYRIKELEGARRALEQENEMLKQKLAGQGSSSSMIQSKMDELSRQYQESLNALREEKEKEIQSLRTQITRIHTERTTVVSNDSGLSQQIEKLIATLKLKETLIKQQEEEIRRLQQERSSSSNSMTKTIVTERHRNRYPILGLLDDNYQASMSSMSGGSIRTVRTTSTKY